MSKIAIVGMQHQGYVLSACFVKIGHSVTAVGTGKMPDEPGLLELMQSGFKSGRLCFASGANFLEDNIKAIQDADFIFLSLDIDFDRDGVKLQPVLDAAREIEKYRSSESILCVTTQVPVGTSETLTKGKVAYIPELLRPHHAVDSFMHADRVIIGSDDVEVARRVADLYLPLFRPILLMGLRSAEMSKHAHNAILATQISFVNEMDAICKKMGADINDVVRAVKADHRVGQASYINPGWSLKGGHVVRDVRILQSLPVKTPLMDAVLEVDDSL